MGDPIEADKAQRRAAIRGALKKEYFTKYFNPFRLVFAEPVVSGTLIISTWMIELGSGGTLSEKGIR